MACDVGNSKQSVFNKKRVNDPTSTSSSPSETAVKAIGKRTFATLRTVHGNIMFKFYPNEAPNTVHRFIQLTESGFYNGVVFHRVIPNFVIQGGDPTGTGRGGSGKKLKAEFNSQIHIKGTVAMARSQSVDSADSQFYIALNTLPHLDGKYTIFGQVTEGWEVLDKISKGDKIISATIEHRK
ncbi:MAG: peptidylprolyl isomerase [Bdellovibrionales bacterium]|nr:peptidylprolyl isomerase [Bdellovibrionales bacterium]MBT3526481.1 peptidylprolyl isomerase [Bdellovibrionales bacterium]